jgi:glycosyltransferase involved in cell wall biosynthesis
MRYALDARCIQDHFPGIGRYAYHLALELPRLAPEDSFVVLTDPSAPNTRYDLALLAQLPNVTLVAAPGGPLSLGQQWRLPALAQRLKLDLYHSPYYIYPYALPCRCLVTVHDIIPHLYPSALPNPRLAGVFRGLVRLSLNKAQAVLVDAAATRADLTRVLKVTKPIHVVPLGVDAAFAPDVPPAEPAWLASLGIERPFALYVGINKPHKNLVRLVEAWATLPAALRQSHQLVLAGWQDPRYPEANRRVVALGLGAEVRFMGGVPGGALPGLYRAATCFVFPSLYEGFGLPVLEAMASGLPVACSAISSLPEVTGSAALLFDPQRPEAIAESLLALLTEAPLRARLSAAGLAQARPFTWQRTAAETLAVYRQVTLS